MAKRDKKEKDRDRASTGDRRRDATGDNGQARPAGGMKELIAGLNEDLSWEFNAVITYRLFASMCSGPWRQELRQFFESEIPDEMGHAMFLADKIVALGGIPTTQVPPVEIASDNRQMLENALQAEIDTIAR